MATVGQCPAPSAAQTRGARGPRWGGWCGHEAGTGGQHGTRPGRGEVCVEVDAEEAKPIGIYFLFLEAFFLVHKVRGLLKTEHREGGRRGAAREAGHREGGGRPAGGEPAASVRPAPCGPRSSGQTTAAKLDQEDSQAPRLKGPPSRGGVDPGSACWARCDPYSCRCQGCGRAQQSVLGSSPGEPTGGGRPPATGRCRCPPQAPPPAASGPRAASPWCPTR